MDDLVAFLNARYDDDEAYARNAFGDHNDAGPVWHEPSSGLLDVGDELIVTNDSQVSRFMERFDPARVLAEVEANRRIVALHGAEPHECVEYDTNPDWRATCYERDCPTLKLLVLPFAGHPDYRQEWKP